MKPFLETHCIACHATDEPEAKLDLESLTADMANQATAATWAAALRKIVTGEMPPEDAARPAAAEVERMTGWIRDQLAQASPATLALHEGGSGNVIEQRLLFDPAFTAAFRSPVRLRRLGPQQYEAFTKTITIGSGGALRDGINLPFMPDSRGVFSDFGAPKMDEPTTGQLLRTALFLVQQQTAFEIKDGAFTPLRRLAWVPGTAGSAGAGMPPEFRKLMDESQEITDADLETAVAAQFRIVLQREPTADEADRFTAFLKRCIADSGRVIGGRHGLAAVLLIPEAVFRLELGGEPAADGRVRLSPREIALGIARTLTDRPPEPWLLADAAAGGLDSREGVAAAIAKILDDPSPNAMRGVLKDTHVKPPFLRFIREFFGYPRAIDVFKDGLDVHGRGLEGNPDHSGKALVEDADKLVVSILEQDRQVLRELLTTNKAFVAIGQHALAIKRRPLTIKALEDLRAKEPETYRKKWGDVAPADLPTRAIDKQGGIYFYCQGYGLDELPDSQPVEFLATERAGLLTHPAWLVAWSGNSENHVIFRGKWIRERLLGGLVPEVPITVDAVLPTDTDKTLRERMAVTRADYCWQCHRLMDPLGLPFEQFDHWGRFRTDELGKPVVATGGLTYTGDHSLEGDVSDPFALIRRLADAPLVEQMFVRHAFRFFMGRNEELGDGPALRAAWQAYREHDGSLRRMVAELLLSDSSLYRVPAHGAADQASASHSP